MTTEAMVRATRPLESCGFGHITDHGDASTGRERQSGRGVLEQHGGILGHLAGHLVVGRSDGILEQVVSAYALGFGQSRDLDDGISSEPPALTATTVELEPPQSETTMPSKPHSLRRMSCSRCLFSCA